MRTPVALSLILAVLACQAPSVDEPATSETEPLRSIVSMEEVMRYMIDPAADSIWGSVVTIVTTDGIEEIAPETPEDWEVLRRHAVTLVESTNLLFMEDRPVAAEGSVSDMPGVDLEPEQIQQLLEANRPAWTALGVGLRDAGLEVLEAVDARDLDALLVAGDGLDLACENCHIQFWYPELSGQTRAAPPS